MKLVLVLSAVCVNNALPCLASLTYPSAAIVLTTPGTHVSRQGSSLTVCRKLAPIIQLAKPCGLRGSLVHCAFRAVTRNEYNKYM